MRYFWPYLFWIAVILFLVAGCGKVGKKQEPIEEKAKEEVRIENATTPEVLENDIIDAGIMRAQDHISQGRYEEAIGLLRQLTEIDPENAELYYLLGKAYEEDDQDELSVEAYMKAIHFDSNIANETAKRGF